MRAGFGFGENAFENKDVFISSSSRFSSTAGFWASATTFVGACGVWAGDVKCSLMRSSSKTSASFFLGFKEKFSIIKSEAKNKDDRITSDAQ